MTLKAGLALVLITAVAQPAPPIEALVAAVRPALPYPDASADGEFPIDNSASTKWFVVWPQPDDTRIVVRANPLHPDTQRAAAEAMDRINAAVAAAERRAQQAYEKAIEELRRTGKGADVDIVTLDDEGVAGERIDAELEVTIELAAVESYTVASSVAPHVAAAGGGAAWIVRLPANTYRAPQGPDTREHFRAAEVRLYFGAVASPQVSREGDQPSFRVTVTPTAGAFVAIVRGNDGLVDQIVADADWSRLAEHRIASFRPNKREG